MVSFPISSITSRKYQTQEVRNASGKPMSRFQSAFQKVSPLHARVESCGSIPPVSRPIREERILKVEQGERRVCARSGL